MADNRINPSAYWTGRIQPQVQRELDRGDSVLYLEGDPSSDRVLTGTDVRELLALLMSHTKTNAVTELILARNELDDDAATAIAVALPNLHSLTELSLVENKIGMIGAQAIAAAIPESTLRNVWLQGVTQGQAIDEAIFAGVVNKHGQAVEITAQGMP